MILQEIQKNCLQCGKIIPEKRRRRPTVKFCSKQCKHRASVARYYERNKIHIEFMFNRSEDQKRIRQERQEKGLCIRCGGEKEFTDAVECSECYIDRKERGR
jgi:hypothetical protein